MSLVFGQVESNEDLSRPRQVPSRLRTCSRLALRKAHHAALPILESLACWPIFKAQDANEQDRLFADHLTIGLDILGCRAIFPM